MIVFIRHGPVSFNIINCPGDYDQIWIVTDNLKSIMITKICASGNELVQFVDYSEAFGEFVRYYDMLTEDIWEFFYPILGYIPLYEFSAGKFVHTPPYPFTSFDAIKARKKPIKFVNILGCNIPKGLVKHMKLLNNISESVEDSGLDYSEYLKFPEHIQPYVSDALEKLSKLRSCIFKLEDMAVYDFLEMLDVINIGSIFYNGGKLIKATPANLLNAGCVDKHPRIKYEFIGSCIEHNNPLLTDTIVECSQIYRNMETKTNMDGFTYRVLKLIISRRGYSDT